MASQTSESSPSNRSEKAPSSPHGKCVDQSKSIFCNAHLKTLETAMSLLGSLRALEARFERTEELLAQQIRDVSLLEDRNDALHRQLEQTREGTEGKLASLRRKVDGIEQSIDRDDDGGLATARELYADADDDVQFAGERESRKRW